MNYLEEARQGLRRAERLLAVQRGRLRRAIDDMRKAGHALQDGANELREKLGLPTVYYLDGSRYLVKRPK